MDPREEVERASSLKREFADEDPTGQGLMLWLVLGEICVVLKQLAAVRESQGKPVVVPDEVREQLGKLLQLVKMPLELGGAQGAVLASLPRVLQAQTDAHAALHSRLETVLLALRESKLPDSVREAIVGRVDRDREVTDAINGLAEALERVETELGTVSGSGSSTQTVGIGAQLVDVQTRLGDFQNALDSIGPNVAMLVRRSSPSAGEPATVLGFVPRLRRFGLFTARGIAVAILVIGLAMAMIFRPKQSEVVVARDQALLAEVQKAVTASTQAAHVVEQMQARTKLVCKKWGPAVDVTTGEPVLDPSTGRQRYEGQECELVIVSDPQTAATLPRVPPALH